MDGRLLPPIHNELYELRERERPSIKMQFPCFSRKSLSKNTPCCIEPTWTVQHNLIRADVAFQSMVGRNDTTFVWQLFEKGLQGLDGTQICPQLC